MCLHALLGGESDERRGEDDRHGGPVAAEQPAERGVGQSDGEQHEDRVDARLGDQLLVAGADLGERQPLVEGVPAQGAEVGVAFEADRQGGDLHHAGDGLAALGVVGRDDRAPLEARQLDVDALRSADPLRIPDHARGMYSRSEQVGGIFGHEIERCDQFFFGLHTGCKNNLFSFETSLFSLFFDSDAAGRFRCGKRGRPSRAPAARESGSRSGGAASPSDRIPAGQTKRGFRRSGSPSCVRPSARRCQNAAWFMRLSTSSPSAGCRS